MIAPFVDPVKITQDEAQFLKDAKNSEHLRIFKKLIHYVADEQDYLSLKDLETVTPEAMILLKGQKLALVRLYNLINFYLNPPQEQPKQSSKAGQATSVSDASKPVV